jgi:hypothetical protein
VNRDELGRCMMLVQAQWPASSRQWHIVGMDYISDAWWATLHDLSVGEVVGAVMALGTDGREYAPTPGQVRARAGELSRRWLSGDDAWALVREQVRRVGSLRGWEGPHKDADGNWVVLEPVWVAPDAPAHVKLIGEVADNMGWDALWQSENEVADRAHFLKLYAERLQRTKQDDALAPLARALLATGQALPNLALEADDGA